MPVNVLITNDATVLGLLCLMLGLIFYTSHSRAPYFQAFYRYVPALLLCYFLPSLLNTFHIIDGKTSNLYYVTSRFLLPSCLVLLTLSIDFKTLLNLGPKVLILFLTGTLGIVLGGPIALALVYNFAPEWVDENTWRGLTTVAGSWIGGGANQTAMKEIFNVDGYLFSMMVTVDIIVANIWMAILLFLAARAPKIDARIGADTSAIETLKNQLEHYHAQHSRPLSLRDLMLMLAICFGVTGMAHACADAIVPWVQQNAPELARFSLTKHFFWVVVLATTAGLILSTTRAKRLEAAGASKVGSAFLYLLIASIGMHMDVTAIADNVGLFILGLIWMLCHAGLLLIVARLIKAPLFYVAVGSQANVGGAASAPIVASAFHPALAPVGVLLAVLGYALGTYAAWLCGQLMRWVTP